MNLRFFTILFACTLIACTSNFPISATVKPNTSGPIISFIDITKFDHELSASLQSKNVPVDVMFYDKVSPNKMPDRLQKWLSVVESDGGKVLVEPPPNELVAKNPFAALSLIGTLVSSLKNFVQFNSDRVYESAKGRDAVIALERNSNGEVLVTRIKFVKRAP